MGWIITHLDDLEADFRTFYRLTPADVARMSGPHFVALAVRLTAYSGVMAARAAAEEQKTESRSGYVESSAASIQSNPALSDLIDYG